MDNNKIYLGDNLDLLKQLEDNSIDSCVSDFPYNLGFMGKDWDTIPNYHKWCNDRAIELFRVLKPGGYCLIFSGTRTQHRMVCAFEDAGFEIKDQIMWVYSQGFPKSHNIGKSFGKHGQTELAKLWDGWGTALKPTHEPIMLAQKPIEGSYCDNVEKYGVGGLYIDGSRIELNGEIVPINVLENWSGFGEEDKPEYTATVNTQGRYPANTIFDEVTGEMLNDQSGYSKSSESEYNFDESNQENTTHFIKNIKSGIHFGDFGGASRFYYCAKSTQKERTENKKIKNTHPTVKPISLIKHLVKLVTPKNGICLDICEGAGSHALACIELANEGHVVNYIGFENDASSVELANQRIEIHKEGM
jgi:site-specific DNA-methyltransferase (adenine-specific)